MMELLSAPDQVLACRVSGKLDAQYFDRMVEALDAKLAAHERVGVFADMTGFETMTAEALMKDLRYNLTRIGQSNRFPRVAVVTEEPWLKAWMQILDPIFPQFEARVFKPGETEAAIRWAAEFPPVRS